MYYELYDTETANLISTFRNEEAARAYVRRAIEASGEAAIESWALGERGSIREECVRDGAELVAWALQ
jgi:hypothetical protein